MRDLFCQWDETSPRDKSGDDAVLAKWDHGTIGKLLIEHAALRLAASEEVARVAREVGFPSLADRLEQSSAATRPIIDRLYDGGRGIQPISLAITPEFLVAVEELHEALHEEIQDESAMRSLGEALGPHRDTLRSARFMSRHAPARPAVVGPWARRFPLIVRLRTAIDRLAGFPWAESSLADRELSQRYDTEG